MRERGWRKAGGQRGEREGGREGQTSWPGPTPRTRLPRTAAALVRSGRRWGALGAVRSPQR